jgi:hypothetical protein
MVPGQCGRRPGLESILNSGTTIFSSIQNADAAKNTNAAVQTAAAANGEHVEKIAGKVFAVISCTYAFDVEMNKGGKITVSAGRKVSRSAFDLVDVNRRDRLACAASGKVREHNAQLSQVPVGAAGASFGQEKLVDRLEDGRRVLEEGRRRARRLVQACAGAQGDVGGRLEELAGLADHLPGFCLG